METRKELVKLCMQKGFLLDKEVLELLSLLDEQKSKKILDFFLSLNLNEKVITKAFFGRNLNKIKDLSIIFELKEELYSFLGSLGFDLGAVKKEIISDVKNEAVLKIISSDMVIPKKIEVQDFVKHFRCRYEQLKRVLQEKNLENLKSIRRISNDRESFHIIVSILDKKITKNKNLMLEVEDTTGRTKVLINGNKTELFELCKDIVCDEVVAFNVAGNKEILFANSVFFPDSILIEKKRAALDEVVAFTSDVHVGSKMFLEENFLKFIKWLNGEEGDEEQRALAKKVKYLFLVGDNVDGIGVYPDQDKLLNILEITLQYKKLAELLKLIREDIQIIISPGQHDAVWVGEPQSAIGPTWAPELCNMKNVLLVTNPCLLEINGGFKVLVYHGASMHGMVEEIQDIRLNFKHNSPTRIVKELLKRRHLAPIHGSCDYIPNEKKDPMVIDIIPDIMVTGDLHRPEISVYNNLLLVASSCWQSITPFEEKVGNNPDPCKVPLFNLKTREIKMLDFSTKKEGTAPASEVKK